MASTKTITKLTDVNDKYKKLIELGAQELADAAGSWSGGKVNSIENDIIKLLSVIESDEMRMAIAIRALAVLASNSSSNSTAYAKTKDRSGIFGGY